MSINFSELAIKRPITTIVSFIALSVFGLLAFLNLRIDLFPNVDIPVISISVIDTGASPTELESSVTKKIEDEVSGLSNIDNIYSITTEGLSQVIIEFKLEANLDRSLQDVRDAVTRVRNKLPSDLEEEPIVKRMDPSAAPVLVYSINSPNRSPLELTKFVEDKIAPVLQQADGVGDVEVRGAYEREIQVYLNNENLKAHGITAIDVSNQIHANNINLPGGKAGMGLNDSLVRTLGSAQNMQALDNSQINLKDGSIVPLSKLGRVEDSYEERYIISKLNGKPSILFYVTRETGASIVSVDKAVKKKMKEINEILPNDIHISLIQSLANYIKKANDATNAAIFDGALLAIIIIFYFLRDIRATIVSGLAIPLSLAGTYLAMYLFGQSINFLTLLAIALVIGVLVDDAIVDLENIVRHIKNGKNPYQAAIDATDEIGIAVIACTFTVVAVFFPMIFINGMIAQFFKSFGLVVSVSVILSLIVARTITPALASIMLRSYKDDETEEAELKKSRFYKFSSFYVMEKIHKFYYKSLSWALVNKWKTIVYAILLFVFGILLFVSPLLQKSFMSKHDQGEVYISVKLPDGSSLFQTQRIVDKIYNYVSEKSGVKDIYSDVGNGISETNTALVRIILDDAKKRNFTTEEFKNDIRPGLKIIPGAKISLSEVDVVSGKTESDIQIILSGDNYDEVANYSEQLAKKISRIRGLDDVYAQASTIKPEWDFVIDSGSLNDLGVSTINLARTLNIATQGEKSSTFIQDQEEHYIRVQMERNIRNDIQSIYNLEVPSSKGFNVPINYVAKIYAKSGPAKITKRNKKKYVTIEGDLNGIALSDAMREIRKIDIFKNPPKGIKIDFEGQLRNQRDAFSGLGLALVVGIVFIYIILVMLFESFIHPLTIMVSLPLSVTGSFLALVITHKELNMMAFIGFIVLMGLVTKNSILLLEYTMKERERGLSVKDALISAGQTRLRPILMTAGATICGLLPLATGVGEGAETRGPMGIAVIGGLITSTMLTLVVIPVVYAIFDSLEQKFSSRFINKNKNLIETSEEN